ncbi:unnamed protein product [Kuraishia capsulata CBS 1993]|uniref:INO80 complex subunit B-like conserved region domain-containing protein n=1 Tax=Kuraishia capsulata CBS 1993 TaxID=1382522 RepID=W6MR01_9ASCO|nr:uncharacterized protein KUCA_T00005108001 [Kuraishia capsulata CBS 1993]CDK29121.1 unnamed protein product [Kuraishia capsulata CBS 1993]
MSESDSMSELSDVADDEVDDSLMIDESDSENVSNSKLSKGNTVVSSEEEDEEDGDGEDNDDDEDDEEEELEEEEDYNPDEYDVDLKLPVDDDEEIAAIDDEDEEEEEEETPIPKAKPAQASRRPARNTTQGLDTSLIEEKSGRGQRARGKPNYAEVGYDDLLDQDDQDDDQEDDDGTGLGDDDFEEDWESATPVADVSRMTGRQKAKYFGTTSEEPVAEPVYVIPPSAATATSSAAAPRPRISQELLALSNEPIKKKILTEEEIQSRRAENARKRKNFNEKRLEEEKRDTLNKLLKKRATKVKTKSALQTEYEEEDERSHRGASRILDKPRRPLMQHKALFTWRSSIKGATPEEKKVELALGIPNEVL